MATYATSHTKVNRKLSIPDFPAPVLRAALATSISNGKFADTAYYLHSERLRNHKIGKPRAVYANSAVMSATASYFRTHFNGETASGQRIEFETEDYGFESDSDIDDCESLADHMQGKEDEDMTVLSQSSSDEDERATELPITKRDKPPKKLELASSQYKHRIVISGVAAKTWQALVHFIYTGKINFAPLKSQGLDFRQAEQTKHCQKYPHLPPLSSPKSVYRLAKIAGISKLQDLARDDLKKRIQKDTIATEVFSKFTSMYDDILNMELKILYTSSLLPDTLPQVLKAVSSISQGSMPHSEKALAALLTKLSIFLTPTPKPVDAPSSQALATIDKTEKDASTSSITTAFLNSMRRPLAEATRTRQPVMGVLSGTGGSHSGSPENTVLKMIGTEKRASSSREEQALGESASVCSNELGEQPRPSTYQ